MHTYNIVCSVYVLEVEQQREHVWDEFKRVLVTERFYWLDLYISGVSSLQEVTEEDYASLLEVRWV